MCFLACSFLLSLAIVGIETNEAAKGGRSQVAPQQSGVDIEVSIGVFERVAEDGGVGAYGVEYRDSLGAFWYRSTP